jgi:hypothetical protein
MGTKKKEPEVKTAIIKKAGKKPEKKSDPLAGVKDFRPDAKEKFDKAEKDMKDMAKK